MKSKTSRNMCHLLKLSRVLLLVALSSLCSCYVCDNFYVPSSQKNGWEDSFSDSLITVNSWTPASSKNVIITTIQFNTKNALDIENIAVETFTNGKMVNLRNVEAKSLEAGISPLKDKTYRQENFKALPKDVKVTNIKGSVVSFTFYNENKGSLDASTVNTSIKIELMGNGKKINFNRNYKLKRKKSCSFRVH